MLFPICPTCGALLSNIQIPYENDMQALYKKHSIDGLAKKPTDDEEFNVAKMAIVNKYTSPDRYCCRMRLINYSDIVRIVN